MIRIFHPKKKKNVNITLNTILSPNRCRNKTKSAIRLGIISSLNVFYKSEGRFHIEIVSNSVNVEYDQLIFM